jgi:hypothetical protein
VLTAKLPPNADGAEVTGLEISRGEGAGPAAHNEAENGGELADQGGQVLLGPLQADGQVVTDWSGWVGRGGASSPIEADGATSVSYSLEGYGAETLIRQAQPTDEQAIPLLVSDDIARAAPGGEIRLQVGQGSVLGKVVAAGKRFPTLGDTFAVADLRALQTALDADTPGSGTPRELWLENAADPGRLSAALARSPYDQLARTSHAATLDALESDPLAHGVLVELAAAALLAALLAVGGLLLAVSSSIRDERHELFDLEVQGVRPLALRGVVRARAGLMLVTGLVCGIPMAALLAWLALDLVRVTAGGESAQPPLLLRTDRAGLAAAAVAVALLSLLAVAAITRSAFAAALPRRPMGGSG